MRCQAPPALASFQHRIVAASWATRRTDLVKQREMAAIDPLDHACAHNAADNDDDEKQRDAADNAANQGTVVIGRWKGGSRQ